MKNQYIHILNPPRALDTLGLLRLKASVTLQVAPEVQTLNFERSLIFDVDGWESELVWQAVHMIVQQHGGKVEALEALQAALKKLQAH